MKNFKLLILFGILTLNYSCSKKLNLWTKQSNIKEVKSFESQLSPKSEILNKNVNLSESNYPKIKEFEIAKPLIIKRDKTDFLPVYAEYFYSKPDSIIRYVSYEWENNRYGNYFDKKKDWEIQSKKLKEYNTEYERIKKQLILEFGQPTEHDNEPKNMKSENGGQGYLSRNTYWESTEKFMKLNMIFGASTYRIRLYYYWK